MTAALQIYSRDFDADFFKLPPELQARIESAIDRLGRTLHAPSPRLVSVAGLAPARPGLKDRLRELLCIDGEIWNDGLREFRW